MSFENRKKTASRTQGVSQQLNASNHGSSTELNSGYASLGCSAGDDHESSGTPSVYDTLAATHTSPPSDHPPPESVYDDIGNNYLELVDYVEPPAEPMKDTNTGNAVPSSNV